MQDEYWMECIQSAFDEHGIVATKEQIMNVARAVKGAHDSYGMAFYEPSGGELSQLEIERLKRDLHNEQLKTTCPECLGRGRLRGACGPSHDYDTQCSACGGKGKVSP